MKIRKKIKKDIYGVLITLEEKGKTIGRSYIYILKNSLHKKPFALVEDVFVEKGYRSQGWGRQLVTMAVKEAKKRKCYKIIATGRNSKPALKKFYRKFGLEVWGVEYRKNL